MGSSFPAIVHPSPGWTAERDTTSAVGASAREFFGTPTYTDGPNHMVFDAKNRVLYAASWGAGVWRMKLP